MTYRRYVVNPLNADSSDRTNLFFDAVGSRSLTVAESLRVLNNMLSTSQTNVTDISVQVAALQTQLASDNRNDIAVALQNLVNSLASANATISTNTANLASHETRLQRFKSKRVTTGSVAAGAGGSASSPRPSAIFVTPCPGG